MKSLITVCFLTKVSKIIFVSVLWSSKRNYDLLLDKITNKEEKDNDDTHNDW